MTAAVDELVGTVVAGRYRVEALLGRGSAGAVYRVEHVHMRKRFALKVLNADTGKSAEQVARFEREAVTAAHIGHPNVAAATDFGRLEDGSFYLILEYAEGPTLARAIDGRPMAPARAVAIARQIASALVRAQELGIVHRDLKPDNVLIGQGDVVKVLDFGIAKLHDGELRRKTMVSENEALTRAGLIYGTPQYMAPEQALGETVDLRADLWALGVILFEMLAGKPPFAGDDLTQLFGQIITGAAPTIAERAPGAAVPPALEALVAKLLSKQPSMRPASARAVLAALDAIAGISPHASRAPAASAAAGPAGASGSQDAAAVGAAGALAATIAAGEPRVIRVPPPSRHGLVATGALVGFLAIAAFAIAMRGRSTGSASGLVEGAGGADAGAAATASALGDDAVRAAEDKGLEAVLRLAEAYPDDVRVRCALASAYLAAGRVDDGVGVLDKLLADVPNIASTAHGAAVVAAASTAAATGNEGAFSALESQLGARGVDALYGLAMRPGPVRTRASKSLFKPDVRAHASPAAAIALDLRAATECDAKYGLLPRAKQYGDARTLAQLKQLTAQKGCGFLNLNDCWRCLRKDGALREAISTVESRGK